MKVELKVIANSKGIAVNKVSNLDEPDGCFYSKNLTEFYFLDVLFKNKFKKAWNGSKRRKHALHICRVPTTRYATAEWQLS